MLATKYASRLLQLHLIPCTLPISLNSLDREGVRLLSRLTDYFQNQLAGVDDSLQVTQPSSRRSSMKIVFFMLFHFQLFSSGAQLGRSGICVAFGVLLLFWFRSRTLIVSGWCNALFMFCVSGDCKPTMYLFPLCITWVVWRLPHLRHCFQCGYASKSCFDTWEI